MIIGCELTLRGAILSVCGQQVLYDIYQLRDDQDLHAFCQFCQLASRFVCQILRPCTNRRPVPEGLTPGIVLVLIMWITLRLLSLTSWCSHQRTYETAAEYNSIHDCQRGWIEKTSGKQVDLEVRVEDCPHDIIIFCDYTM